MSKIKHSFLPYGRQNIGQEDIAAVADALRGDWLTTGPMVEQFEAALAARTDARYAVVCSNGSTALHLAALGAGLSSGQVAIVPAVTFQATANAALQAGAEVVFADVDPETALMSPQHLVDAITRAQKDFPNLRVSCVLPVHMAGNYVAMADFGKVAREYNLTIIEDAAHAIGTVSTDGAVGSCLHSDFTTFSFHPVKTITTCEGGAITTNDKRAADRLRQLRNHGIIRNPAEFTDQDAGFEDELPNPWYYEVNEPGFNYRLPDIQCALGLSQLGRLDDFIAQRGALWKRYRARFDGAEGVSLASDNESALISWHLAVALIDFDHFGTSRGHVMRGLSKAGFGTQVHYIPLYRHPFYRNRYGNQQLPGAEAYYARALSLPLHANMAIEDVDRVVDELLNILNAAA